MNKRFGNTEILQIAESIAREKGIPKEQILEALEDAIRVAARRKYGYENPVEASINKSTGEIQLYREMLVVDNLETAQSPDEQNVQSQENEKKISKITIEYAKTKKPDAKIGEIIQELLPPLEIGRLAAQSAKQIITVKLKEIERNKQYNEFKDRVGDIVNGIVEKIEARNIIIKIGSAEAVLKKEYMLKSDNYRQGDRVRAYLLNLDKDSKGPMIILSRTHNEFLAMLFKQEVPEIYDRIIEVKGVARDPGSKSKIAVYSSDKGVDAVGSCVGIRGSRVQSITNELRGEKIDIIQWSSDVASFAINALAPAQVSKVIIDEEQNKMEVIVPDDNQSQAIGRRGQNVRLASDLIGWKVDILTEEIESKRRQEEFGTITTEFMEHLNLEEILAQLLASEGFTSIKELAEAEVSEISSIEGLDEEIAKELIERAQEYLKENKD